MKKHYVETVVSNVLIARNTYLMKVTCGEELLRWFRPGQFAHIEVPHARESLLRRPISISSVDYEKRQVHFAYQPVGKGTRLLTLVGPGDMLDLLMPLGNGFSINEDMKKIWLAGGGIGCAPLKSVMDKYPDREYKAFLGYRNRECVYLEKEFAAHAQVFLTTDDGSYGTKGFCTDALAEELKKDKPDVILACGPHLFFKSLARTAADVPVQVSLEQRMGCGTGGCATCVCKVGGEYRRVCVQGPVFEIGEVDGVYD